MAMRIDKSAAYIGTVMNACTLFNADLSRVLMLSIVALKWDLDDRLNRRRKDLGVSDAAPCFKQRQLS